MTLSRRLDIKQTNMNPINCLLILPAGIKEGLYDVEALAAYLLYGLNVLNPICALTSLQS